MGTMFACGFTGIERTCRNFNDLNRLWAHILLQVRGRYQQNISLITEEVVRLLHPLTPDPVNLNQSPPG